MDPFTLVILFAGIVGMIGVGFALLPNAVDHPLPQGFIDGITTLYGWLHSFNELFPVDTLLQVLTIGIFVQITTRLLWPSILWVIKTISGGGQ